MDRELRQRALRHSALWECVLCLCSGCDSREVCDEAKERIDIEPSHRSVCVNMCGVTPHHPIKTTQKT